MRDRAIRFTVAMKTVTGYNTPSEYQSKYCGRPGAKGLAKFVADYNESLKPGGVNAHIGDRGRCYAASLRDHGTVIAEWKAPMFEVVG